MNSREALDILDRLRPGDEDSPGEVEVRAARDVVAADPDLGRIVARREAFDRRAGEVMADIEVPTDLRDRLLQSLGLETDDASVAIDPAASPRTSRRGWMVAAAASVAGAVGLGAWWFNRAGTPAPTLFDYHRAAVTSFDGLERLPAFEGDARLPMIGWERGRIRVAERARALTVGPNTVAAYGFVLPTRSGPAHGVLVVIPSGELEELPSRDYFDADDATYTRQYASVSWVERDWTYVCVVDDRATLEDLAREFDVTPA